MAKNNTLKKYTEELEDDFDFPEESPGDEIIAGMMSGQGPRIKSCAINKLM